MRLRVRIEGVVQGVGFRPHVHALAESLALEGFVRNDPQGVLVEVEGAPAALETFLERVGRDAPPLASVDRITSERVPDAGDRGAAEGLRHNGPRFRIVESAASAGVATLVSPDTAPCASCLAELLDPGDRRHRYPFINCTNCGPRFTIVRGIPYDRGRTTMATFLMCEPCRAEYDDPRDRRFHAQPNACPDCGPSVRLLHPDGSPAATAGAQDPVEAAARALASGAIVAVKGVGGYHLACVADDEEAVAALRARKHREEKPFALMVPDLEAARRLAYTSPEEEGLLSGRERPIVLVRRREGAAIAPGVAPGHRDLGLMLPYSPLHHLLLGDLGRRGDARRVLVMTSGNVSDEPIAYRDDDALDRLGSIADLFLAHDRPIETRTDDSVVRVVRIGEERRPLMLRRSRGWVPVPSALPVAAPRPVLACGAHLKNTFAVARRGRVWVGPHVGDLENVETLTSFREGIAHFEALFEIAPDVLAHDMHLDYFSTGYAVERAEIGRAESGPTERTGVQHHHAHLAACLAEHGEKGPALGAIFDGTGYGTDATIWGGELLLGDLVDFERVGHLRPVRMPGGAAAVREPWRMALAWLVESSAPRAPSGAVPPLPRTLEGTVDAERWAAVGRLLRSGLRSPPTTSVGRLFDAVSALCGIRARTSYEGQAAIALEMAASHAEDEEGACPVAVARSAQGGSIIDPRPAIRAVVEEMERASEGAVDPTRASIRVAARFHEGLARATARACLREADRGGVDAVVLSGGVFQNVLFLERVAALLLGVGLRPLVPSRHPPNDGGIAFGQVAVAAAREALGKSVAPPSGRAH